VTGTIALREAMAGLLSLAAAEEQILLAVTMVDDAGDRGSAGSWAAAPLVAHNNQFKDQQAERIRAIASGQVPPAFGYYLTHGQPERAVALQAHALATARYLRAPARAAGLAGYSLACALAQAGQPDEALRTLAEAIAANPDLRANAARDPDFAVLRETGQLSVLPSGGRAAQ
jgi:tetratricopeptide (TPR) repeat protein